MTRRDQIRDAYRLTGNSAGFYDGMMTCSTLPGRAVCRLVWNMDREKNLTYIEKALSGIPEHFQGKLLEVPVGTGVLTMPVYRDLPGADITCLDYSPDMMKTARARAESLRLYLLTMFFASAEAAESGQAGPEAIISSGSPRISESTTASTFPGQHSWANRPPLT